MTDFLGPTTAIMFLVGAFCWAMNDGPKDSPFMNRVSEVFVWIWMALIILNLIRRW